MIKTLQNTLKQDKEHLSVPKSVQDTIPIHRLWPDGLFQFGGKFSKTVRFSDINYAIASLILALAHKLPSGLYTSHRPPVFQNHSE